MAKQILKIVLSLAAAGLSLLLGINAEKLFVKFEVKAIGEHTVKAAQVMAMIQVILVLLVALVAIMVVLAMPLTTMSPSLLLHTH